MSEQTGLLPSSSPPNVTAVSGYQVTLARRTGREAAFAWLTAADFDLFTVFKIGTCAMPQPSASRALPQQIRAPHLPHAEGTGALRRGTLGSRSAWLRLRCFVVPQEACDGFKWLSLYELCPGCTLRSSRKQPFSHLYTVDA
jgi:hypothetical protein